ncbi:5'-3' exonuclease H3TH domain-containing protein [Viridibacillus sp. FSL R5-0477]|uniref:5'-3' exonuclease n=1 Tax=Viridibacillus arenosi FSL R5-213 TaxID=1227360 RepID=W4EN35_9BACL|nr:5'-3' exonuclease H3TH domain-containing protein [Viridibacillus arenosi]ETT81978.1 5'-3' exonuclease [Viridibacillus arenosi FSL R5-213]OMC90489.1 flap endonuclease [Viridibacillus arenosi]
MNEQPHILVVDGMALLFRSFFATAPMNQFFRKEDGTPTNGVQGFARHVLTAQSMMKPTHLAVCWDMGVHTFRNELFDGYKANRPSPPDELKPQFDMAKEVSEMIGWKNFGEVGMEADDTIGSIVEKWKNDAKITVVSGDKDLLQLLNPSTTIALTKKGYTEYNVYDVQRFEEEYAIAPALFADVKAFMGDSSDGYPGVKGIGPKTALSLIQKYGTVDGVLAAIDELKPAQRSKITEYEEMLRLSHQLAKIHTEVPIHATIDDLSLPLLTQEKLDQLTMDGYSLISRHAKSLFPNG